MVDEGFLDESKLWEELLGYQCVFSVPETPPSLNFMMHMKRARRHGVMGGASLIQLHRIAIQ